MDSIMMMVMMKGGKGGRGKGAKGATSVSQSARQTDGTVRQSINQSVRHKTDRQTRDERGAHAYTHTPYYYYHSNHR